jgi:hypothetical protein
MKFLKDGKEEKTNWFLEALHNVALMLEKFYESIRYDLIQFFKNVWKYREILWSDRDHDYAYLTHLISFKLLSMSEYIGKADMFETSQQTAQELRGAAEALQRFSKANYREEEFAAHDEKWGELGMNFVSIEGSELKRMESFRKNVKTKEDEAQEHKEFQEIVDRAELDRDKDKEKAFNLIRDKLENWWM